MRKIYATILTSALVAGCNSRTPQEPEKAREAPSVPTVQSQPSTSSTAPASPPPEAKTQSDAKLSRVRSLLAAYLESDGHGGWRKNEKAATELEKLDATEVEAAWTLLGDQSVQIRQAAAVFLLEHLDPANSEHVAAYQRLLTDSDRMVRARGIDALRQCSDVEQIKALPQLAALLDPRTEDRPENRVAAVRLLGTLKQAAAESLTAVLSAAANDPDAKVRSAAVVSAAAISTSGPVVEALGKALADSEEAVRVAAAGRLRQLGPAAASAATPLASALGDPNSDVAEAAAEALIRIGPASVDALARQLASDRADAKKLALAALIKIGPAAKPAIGAIEKCRQDADPQVRQLAETALKRLGPP